MPEITKLGGATFADINPALFITVPTNALRDADYADFEGLHLGITKSLQYRTTPDLLSADPTLPKLPWSNSAKMGAHTDMLSRWRPGLSREAQLLETVEDFIDPETSLLTNETESRILLNDALMAYTGLLKIVSNVEQWSVADTNRATGHLFAELIAPQKLLGWQWWNTQALGFTKRKIELADGLLSA